MFYYINDFIMLFCLFFVISTQYSNKFYAVSLLSAILNEDTLFLFLEFT